MKILTPTPLGALERAGAGRKHPQGRQQRNAAVLNCHGRFCVGKVANRADAAHIKQGKRAAAIPPRGLGFCGQKIVIGVPTASRT